MPLQVADFIGLGVSGFLGLLWLDIRKVKALFDQRGQEILAAKSEIMVEVGKRMDDKDGGFLTADKHKDLCRIAGLEQNNALLNEFSKMLDAKFAKNGFTEGTHP